MTDEVMARLARSFEQGASEYERLRPGYPEQMWADLAAHAGPRLQGRVLDVGAGTGRATFPLIAAGAHVDVVEPSGDMLGVLRARLEADGLTSRATLRRATFEDVAPGERFDAVVAAQSFHWADPATRWQRLASVLRPAGLGFLCWNGWSLDAAAHDLAAVERVYAQHGDGELVPDIENDRSDARWAEDEIATSGDVRLAARHRYEWPWTMPTRDYLDLLATTSQYLVAEPATRKTLLTRLGDVLGPETTLAAGTLLLVVAPT